MKKSAIELVIEAVANSDVVTIDDMESLDIRDKWKFDLDNTNILEGVNLGYDFKKENSILFKMLYEAERKQINPIELISKIYFEPRASIEVIYQYVMFGKEDIFVKMVVSRIKENPYLLHSILKEFNSK